MVESELYQSRMAIQEAFYRGATASARTSSRWRNGLVAGSVTATLANFALDVQNIVEDTLVQEIPLRILGFAMACCAYGMERRRAISQDQVEQSVLMAQVMSGVLHYEVPEWASQSIENREIPDEQY